jgi:hypothetical protein
VGQELQEVELGHDAHGAVAVAGDEGRGAFGEEGEGVV